MPKLRSIRTKLIFIFLSAEALSTDCQALRLKGEFEGLFQTKAL